jgi:hypothetical protein
VKRLEVDPPDDRAEKRHDEETMGLLGNPQLLQRRGMRALECPARNYHCFIAGFIGETPRLGARIHHVTKLFEDATRRAILRNNRCVDAVEPEGAKRVGVHHQGKPCPESFALLIARGNHKRELCSASAHPAQVSIADQFTSKVEEESPCALPPHRLVVVHDVGLGEWVDVPHESRVVRLIVAGGELPSISSDLAEVRLRGHEFADVGRPLNTDSGCSRHTRRS